MFKKMNRRQFLFGMGAAATTPFLPPVDFSQKRKPNVLFLLMDDMTYRAIGCLNNPEVQTPNIDRLVRRGTTFTHAFNEGSWTPAVCLPARCMLTSGLHIWHAKKALPDFKNIPLWGETFGKHGYETFFTGKWHLGKPSVVKCAKYIGPHSGSFDRGMVVSNGNQYFRPHRPNQQINLSEIPKQYIDNWTAPWKTDPDMPWRADNRSLSAHWIESNPIYDKEWVKKHCPDAQHSSDIWTQAAVDFIKNPPGGGKKPLFMHVAFFTPHDPRQSPVEYLDRYPVDKVNVPPNFLPEFPFDQGDHANRDEIIAPFPRTPHDIQVHRREYYAAITYADKNIGRILDTLDETGLGDNTIIIFTSDHGLAVGQQGLMGKEHLFDNAVRVPLIMAGPGIPSGQQVDRMLYHGSLFATTCELVDIPIPETIEKESFADLATGQKRNTAQQPIYGVYRNFQRSIRTDRYKLIEYRVKGQKHTQLFDLQENPWEIVAEDLSKAPSKSSLIKELRKQLHELQKKYGDPMELV